MFGRVSRYSLVALVLCGLLAACAQREQAAPVKRVYQGNNIYDFEPASLDAETYTVQAGDTLYSIAFRANIDVRTLARYNRLDEPFTIFPGQQIVLSKEKNVQTTDPNLGTVRNAPEQRVKPTATRTKVKQEAVDQQQNKEYVDQENEQKVSPVEPSPNTEVYPDSQEIYWQWPGQGAVISDFSTAEAGNKGIDLAGEKGHPVMAAAAGKVVYAGNALKGYGNLIILKHNDDYISAYAHNDTLLVKEQQWVNAGDEIATMGNTDTDRVRLHFEIRYRGKSVNPRHYLPRGHDESSGRSRRN